MSGGLSDECEYKRLVLQRRAAGISFLACVTRFLHSVIRILFAALSTLITVLVGRSCLVIAVLGKKTSLKAL